jgi:DNA-binding CsgD family transcriptional regulator
LAADFLFLGQYVASLEDPGDLAPYVLDEDFPVFENPIGRVVGALAHAKAGNQDIAERMARRSLRQLDLESSYLLLTTRCAAVAEALGDESLAREIIELLEPWRAHVAVDSNAWWCDGPVDRWLASMSIVVGEIDRAADLVASARPMAQSLNDARSMRALSLMEQRLGSAGSGSRPGRNGELVLTPRQERVLALMAEGLTNREIADRLSFSTSTVRVETMAIYRLFSVRSRAEAVAKAVSLRLVPGLA